MAKYIFDFDDVLFHNTAKLKPHMFKILEEAGIPEQEAEIQYKIVRENGFTMRKFIQALLHDTNRNNLNQEELYNKIMIIGKDLINKPLLEIIRKLGKNNCYMVTHGVVEHQLDKINRTEIKNLFSEIFIVQGTKKDAVEKICATHQDEPVFFIDDKEHHFKNLDYKKYPNLKTILYTGQDLSTLVS